MRKITNKDKTYMDVEDLKVYQSLCKLHIEVCDPAMNGRRRNDTNSGLRSVDPRTVLRHSWLKSMMIGIFAIRLKA